MKIVFIKKLEDVRNQYEAIRTTLDYVIRRWEADSIRLGDTTDKPPKKKMEELVSKQDCLEALKHLETVYTVRLFSVFEGILKEHIVLSHPHIHLPEDAKAIWLIDRVANLQTPHISSSIREHAHNVRKYRNYLIHSANVAANVDFDDALFYLSKYVAKLPAPPA